MSGESIRDRLASLSRGELVALVVVFAATLGGAGLWYVRSLPRPIEVRADLGSGRAAALASASPQVLLVHVAGWVREPGVYEFQAGDRVIDAVQAAGGPRKGADLDSLNLAAALVDGTQVLVHRAPPSTPGGGFAASTGSTPGPAAKININTATAAELEALPGVGEVIAQRIVDYRTQNGPFASVDGLIEVSGIGPATLAEMRDIVTV